MVVQVEYEELPAVMSIEEAIAAESFHPQFDRTIARGDVDAAFAAADVACVVEGDARMAGQEHFYLEPHCNFVQPLESDEFLLVASTQVRALVRAFGRFAAACFVRVQDPRACRTSTSTTSSWRACWACRSTSSSARPSAWAVALAGRRRGARFCTAPPPSPRSTRAGPCASCSSDSSTCR